MIHYRITRFDGPDIKAHCHFHRATAAREALRDLIYQMLAANALLNRPVAYRLMKEFDEAEISPPPHGHYRSQLFEIGGNYLDSVKIIITREN